MSCCAGLETVPATAGQRQVLWVISHPESIETAECEEADLVLVASPRFAEHLRTRTSTPSSVSCRRPTTGCFGPVDRILGTSIR